MNVSKTWVVQSLDFSILW